MAKGNLTPSSNPLPFPWRGIGALIVFMLAAPPAQLLTAALLTHHFIGGRQILFEIGAVLQQDFWPHWAGSYSFYMPVAFSAAVWCAHGIAAGKGLSLGGAVWRMILCGLACEAIYQAAGLAAGQALRADFLLLGLAQWIISALLCWLIAARLGLCRAQAR